MLCATDPATGSGAPDSNFADIGLLSATDTVRAIAQDGSNGPLFIGGHLTGPTSAGAWPAFAMFNIDDASGGAVGFADTRWGQQATTAGAYAVAISPASGGGSNIIIGGDFETVWETPSYYTRRGVAAFTTGGTLQSWQPNVLTPSSGEVVRALLVDPGPPVFPGTVWIGGEYTGGSPHIPVGSNGHDLGIYLWP